MREILFRGYSTAERMWVFGDLSHTTDKSIHISNENCFVKVNPETIGQYTGLTDKNGKQIFEGDMLAFSDRLAYVHWHEYCGCWDCSYIKSIDGKKTSPEQRNPNRWRVAAEIIGNIHDNPELFGGDTND